MTDRHGQTRQMDRRYDCRISSYFHSFLALSRLEAKGLDVEAFLKQGDASLLVETESHETLVTGLGYFYDHSLQQSRCALKEVFYRDTRTTPPLLIQIPEGCGTLYAERNSGVAKREDSKLNINRLDVNASIGLLGASFGVGGGFQKETAHSNASEVVFYEDSSFSLPCVILDIILYYFLFTLRKSFEFPVVDNVADALDWFASNGLYICQKVILGWKDSQYQSSRSVSAGLSVHGNVSVPLAGITGSVGSSASHTRTNSATSSSIESSGSSTKITVISYELKPCWYVR